jgi:hypothetical protein
MTLALPVGVSDVLEQVVAEFTLPLIVVVLMGPCWARDDELALRGSGSGRCGFWD